MSNTMIEEIRTVIVEDEERSIRTLSRMLEDCCSSIKIIGVAKSLQEAVHTIKSTMPDLVFLDVALPDGNGYEIFKEISQPSFKVVFVTAYNQYAIKAFELAAIHYILKPVNPAILKEAVIRYEREIAYENISKEIFLINESLKDHQRKILLPTIEGYEVVQIKDILYCEADRSYTTIYTEDGHHFLVSKSLGYYETVLGSCGFFRVHNKFLVNLTFVKKFLKAKGGSLLLVDGTEIMVARSRKAELLEAMNNNLT